MRTNRDPRLADISSRHSNATTDLPGHHPNIEQPNSRKKDPPAIPYRSPFRWNNRPEWFTTFLAALGVGLIAYMVYYAAGTVTATMKRNQNHQTITDVWRQLLMSNVAVSGNPTRLNDADTPLFPSVSFSALRSEAEVHRSLRLTAVLPGIRRIDLSPESTRFIGRGLANDSTLQILANNFKEIDVLDLSGTNITTLKPIEEVQIRELKIINTTLKPDNLTSLTYFTNITDLWVGWHGNTQESDPIYFSDIYRSRLVEAMSGMKGLRNVHYYEMNFTKEEREKLSGINLIQVK